MILMRIANCRPSGDIREWQVSGRLSPMNCAADAKHRTFRLAYREMELIRLASRPRTADGRMPGQTRLDGSRTSSVVANFFVA